MRDIKKLLLLSVIAVNFLGCEGCGKRAASDEIEKQMNYINGTDDNEATTVSEDIPEHIEYTIEGGENEYSVKVNADIIADMYNNMGIYELENETLTEDELRRLAESLFDDGEYTVKKPFWMMSETELQEASDWWYSRYELADSFDNIELMEIENLHLPDGEYSGELQEGKLIYELGDTGFAESYITGYVDGEEWTLRYRENPYMLEFKPRIVESVCSQYEALDSRFAENIMDYDDAEGKAFAALEKLGVNDMLVWDVKQRSFVVDGNIYLDGYQFVFTKSPDGRAKTVMYSMNNANRLDYENPRFVEQEYAVVEVDSKGYLYTDIYNRNKIVAKMSDETQKLEFEKINEIVKNYYTEYTSEDTDILYSDSISDDIKIEKIILAYIAVAYDDKKILMPYWVYQSEDIFVNALSYSGVIAVNALDGEIVMFSWNLNYYGYNLRRVFKVDTLLN